MNVLSHLIMKIIQDINNSFIVLTNIDAFLQLIPLKGAPKRGYV